jgi:curved DNA-binding protein CbpA
MDKKPRLGSDPLRWKVRKYDTTIMSEMDKYYQILGFNPGASEEEIKQNYKDLVNLWHPDRLSDPRLKEKAKEKLKGINKA